MFNVKFVVILICVINVNVCSDINENHDDDEFVPTNEWKVIKEGQKIPKGLHVRINLQTGLKEAKLLDDKKESQQNQNALLEIPNNEDSDKDSVKEALKNIKSDDVLEPEKLQQIKDSFRTYSQLKEEMKELNLDPKMDAEILSELFEEYKEEIEKETLDEHSIIRILEDYDYLAHQIDNGLEFVKQDGFNRVIYKNLNLTNNRIKEETLKLFGSLVQNNGKVQIHALETGAITTLLKVLSLETSVEVKIRALFALGCLLRRFPLAQLKFVENGGISVITKLLEQDSFRIQIKIVTLVTDLILEKNMAFEDEEYEHRQMLIDQYKLVNIKELLLQQGWCEHLNKLLMSLLLSDKDDHDSIERCAIAMQVVRKNCIDKFNVEVLSKLRDWYKYLSENESDFYVDLYNVFDDILRSKNVKTEL